MTYSYKPGKVALRISIAVSMALLYVQGQCGLQNETTSQKFNIHANSINNIM